MGTTRTIKVSPNAAQVAGYYNTATNSGAIFSTPTTAAAVGIGSQNVPAKNNGANTPNFGWRTDGNIDFNPNTYGMKTIDTIENVGNLNPYENGTIPQLNKSNTQYLWLLLGVAVAVILLKKQ